MHKLLEYVCSEMSDLERKADKDGKLSMAEMSYLDTLAHTKKNLLKAEEMSEEGYSNGYSMNRSYGDNSYRGNSYARRRDSRGRYSRDYSRGGYSMSSDDMVAELRELMNDAPDDRTRMEFEKFIRRVESM